MTRPRASEPSPSARGAFRGLCAAALFGLSAPVAKLLIPGSDPLALAALLYIGAGLGLTVWTVARRRAAGMSREAPVRASDLPTLAGVVLSGGVIAPVLMLVGLVHVSGATGALLLNLEAPLTVLLAVAFLREHVGRSQLAAVAMIVAGGVALAYGPGGFHASPLGALSITGACLMWAVDNSLTQRLSLRDPVAVVRIKTLAAGSVNLVLTLALGAKMPRLSVALATLVVGLVSYGASLVLYVGSLRLAGTARGAAYFATAPFVGAAAAIPLLGERPGFATMLCAILMAAGVILLFKERHSHLHIHEEIAHEHLHDHDAHHQHAHEGASTEPHSHVHSHRAIVHEHPHAPDAHHRHRH